MNIIPLVNDTAYNFDIALGNRSFNFFVDWNSLFEFWTIRILDANQDLVIQGLKLILNEEIILRYVDPRLPDGALAVVDTTTSKKRLGFESFVTTSSLIFIPRDEL